MAESSASPPSSARIHMGEAIVQKIEVRPRFAIRPESGYDYNTLGDLDPDELYAELLRSMHKIGTRPKDEDDKRALLEEHYVDVLCRMVHGSNMIENAGACLDHTSLLCADIFKGRDDGPEEITESDGEYKALESYLQDKKMPSDGDAVRHTRREILQHARAAQHIFHQVAILDKDITEDLLVETHGVLTHKLDCPDSDLTWQQYSGVYRSTPVVAGFSSFPPPAQVPRRMRGMIAELNADLARATRTGRLDPVMLAAKFCHKFVNIHPFADGNGRSCRLLLNAILLKYCGLVVCLGENASCKDKYLAIAAAGSMSEMSDLDDHDDNMPARHWKELASFTLLHATESARKVLKVLEKKD